MNNHTEMLSAKHGQTSGIRWLWICLGVIALALIAINVFNVSVGNVFFVGALLACPLMHIWMMKDGGHKH